MDRTDFDFRYEVFGQFFDRGKGLEGDGCRTAVGMAYIAMVCTSIVT